jgi:TusA-related sulfurtransferase
MFRVLATDPMSIIDIPHEVSRSGATLLQQDHAGEEIHFKIRAAG